MGFGNFLKTQVGSGRNGFCSKPIPPRPSCIFTKLPFRYLNQLFSKPHQSTTSSFVHLFQQIQLLQFISPVHLGLGLGTHHHHPPFPHCPYISFNKLNCFCLPLLFCVFSTYISFNPLFFFSWYKKTQRRGKQKQFEFVERDGHGVGSKSAYIRMNSQIFIEPSIQISVLCENGIGSVLASGNGQGQRYEHGVGSKTA